MTSAWSIKGHVITRTKDGASYDTSEMRRDQPRRPRPLAPGETRKQEPPKARVTNPLYAEYVAWLNAGGVPERVHE